MIKEYLTTPIGLIEVSGDDTTIYSVQFAEEVQETPTYTFLPRELAKCMDQLQAYFAGELDHFELNLADRGTAFQKKVWQMTAAIPKGSYKTYKQVHSELGEGSARAVGQALGRNPFLLVIPCHRVLASSGDLTGYAGGITRKSWLLQFEKAYEAPTQLSLF
jgi:methylated-DNA-[protein]-cysteine S-methyltransferase